MEVLALATNSLKELQGSKKSSDSGSAVAFSQIMDKVMGSGRETVAANQWSPTTNFKKNRPDKVQRSAYGKDMEEIHSLLSDIIRRVQSLKKGGEK